MNRRTVLSGVCGTGGFALSGCLGILDDEPGIQDWHDLAAVREDLDGEYELASDLDADTAGYAEHVGEPEQGWLPIGETSPEFPEENMFSGRLDGNGHVISDLKIHRTDRWNFGLFGAIDDAVITDVELENVSIEAIQHVGALAGINEGQVSECSASGYVSGHDVGGLVGYNGGEVNESSATCIVEGSSNVGGLIGNNENKVIESYANSTVEGEKWVGGLVGDNKGDVSDSYATGPVDGEDYVGGLVGTNRGEVSDSYATGTVEGDEAVGGLVGDNRDEGMVSESYWDTVTTGMEHGIGDDEADVSDLAGLETSEMQGEAARENMPGLDFENTWQVVTSPDEYPILLWMIEEGDHTPTPSG